MTDGAADPGLDVEAPLAANGADQKRHQRVVVTKRGGPDVLKLVEEDRPEPGAGEVRVAVLAAGVSAFDLMYRRWAGWLPGSPRVPFSLGEDIVGTVDKLGPGASSLEPGQTVAGATWGLGVGGGYAEAVCLPEADLIPVPSNMDPATAVCLVVNYLTAHLHLHGFGSAVRGERVLVHGAAGGVGTALLDLGRLAGLEMYGTASERNHELVSVMGATPIDYRKEDFVASIRSLTGEGVDVVVDPIGGARHLRRSYRALAERGRLVWLGAAATKEKGLRVGLLSMLTLFWLRLIPDGKRVPTTPDAGAFARKHHEWYRTTLAALLDSAAAGEIEPVVAERIPLAEAARAHAALERGGHAGKLVLVPSA
ncbi:MAG: zinc-binding dehydrogenase [Solirubrobacterales bacterium]